MKFDSDTRFKKDFVKLTDSIKEDGIVDLKYTDFDYLPTLRCNLNCKHCRQAEVRPNKEWTEISDELSFDELKNAWDNIDVKGKIVKINGGEPFVKKEMFDIFGYFKDRGAYNIVATNALIFKNPDNIDKLKSYNLVEITTSFDGIGKTHDDIRGYNGLFDIVLNFSKEMAKDHKVLWECCVQQPNVNQLPEMLRLRDECGVYKIRFQLPVFTSEREIAVARILMDEKIDYEAQSLLNARYDFSYDDLFSNFMKMKGMAIPFDMHPKYFYDDNELPKLCYERKVRRKYNLLCTYMFRTKIDPNGDIRFCPYIIKSFGNITKDNFYDVWNSEEFKDFRMKILNSNMLPSCENCPHLRIHSEKEEI